VIEPIYFPPLACEEAGGNHVIFIAADILIPDVFTLNYLKLFLLRLLRLSTAHVFFGSGNCLHGRHLRSVGEFGRARIGYYFIIIIEFNSARKPHSPRFNP
jgi:hypothetical protein